MCAPRTILEGRGLATVENIEVQHPQQKMNPEFEAIWLRCTGVVAGATGAQGGGVQAAPETTPKLSPQLCIFFSFLGLFLLFNSTKPFLQLTFPGCPNCFQNILGYYFQRAFAFCTRTIGPPLLPFSFHSPIRTPSTRKCRPPLPHFSAFKFLLPLGNYLLSTILKSFLT